MKHKGKIIVFAILAVIFGITSQIADSMTRGTDSPFLYWLSPILLTLFWIFACITAYFGLPNMPEKYKVIKWIIRIWLIVGGVVVFMVYMHSFGILR